MVSVSVKELAELAARVGETLGETTKAAVKTGERAGSVTSSVLTFVAEHPYITTAGIAGAGIAGITLIGATSGVVSDLKEGAASLLNGENENPNAAVNKYVVDSSGKQVLVTAVSDKSVTDSGEDTGLLGWFTKSFTTGLFGSQANTEDLMTKAKPWLIGGAVVIGIVAVGYTVKSLRKPTRVVLS